MRQSRDYTWAETAVRAGVCLVLAEYALTACSHPFQPNRVSALDQTYEFTLLGIEHILPGYDHLLFLLGLHILDRKITHVLKIITAFTLAHSLTLALAALDVVVLPARLVEAAIALSIAYIAVENILIRRRPEKRWIVALVFGLVHGFGFAGILRDIGLAQTDLLISLFAFNIGVEVGQIGVIALLFPVLVVVGRLRRQLAFQRIVSAFILVCGLVWFV